MPVSEPADTLEEYKEKRTKAEHNSDRSRPYLSSDALHGERTRLEAHVGLFKAGYNSIDDVNSIFSKDDFTNFIQELVKDIPRIHGELVDILDPSREFVGIEHTEPNAEAWGNGHIRIVEFMSPLKFLRAKQPSRDQQTLWYYDANPWKSLNFPEPTRSIVTGDVTADELNRKLARTIDDRENLELPTEYQHLID